MRPRLHGTPLSHFTRKLRILLAEFGVEFDLVPAPNGVLATDAAGFGDNPLMRVPTLVHDGETLIESDHIARYLVRTYDPDDRFGVRSERTADLNRLAMANGVMANEVVLILAKRGGLADLERVVYFQKLALGIDNGLAWLDAHTDPDAPGFDYRDIATICMWQHVVHYAIATGLERAVSGARSAPEGERGLIDRYPRIAARVARFADRPSVANTAPR